MTLTPPLDFYTSVIEQGEGELQLLGQLTRRVEIGRVLLILLAIFAWIVRNDVNATVAWSIVLLAIVVFVFVVRYHARLRRDITHHQLRLRAARAGIARIQLDWNAMPPLRHFDIPDGWPSWLARDLDVVGERSLARLADSTSLDGLKTLGEWLLSEPATVREIVERQRSVADLRERHETLLHVSAESRFGSTASSSRSREALLRWCDSPENDRVHLPSWLPVVPLMLTAMLFAFIVAQQWNIATAFAMPVAVINIGICVWARRRLRANIGEFEIALLHLRSTQRLLEIVVSIPPIKGRFGTIQHRLREVETLPALEQLLRLVEWSEVRHSPMLYWVMNATIGFDAHIATRLDAWRRHHAHHLPEWLRESGEAGALFALGMLAYEHPHWRMPSVHELSTLPRFDVRQMAHPLLDPLRAVANDASLNDGGDAMVVSGANMSGKSTYLRAIGLNALLAQAGSVVAAESLQLHRCRVRTSVRVDDDLGSGTSLFLAEVKRVKAVVDEASDDTRPPVLYLLDEILHGTNAADRRAASRRVLVRLRATRAVGVVATHDPTIADDVSAVEKGRATARSTPPQQQHFSCKVLRGQGAEPFTFEFDYRVRPGPATESNAMEILELLIPFEG